jgi:hypothetical protein
MRIYDDSRFGVVGLFQGWEGGRVGFINIKDMYKNDVGKGARVYEGYGVK